MRFEGLNPSKHERTSCVRKEAHSLWSQKIIIKVKVREESGTWGMAKSREKSGQPESMTQRMN